MKLEIPGYVKDLMDLLNNSGYECYVVGGAVRSLLLGLPVHDYDLTTNALPQQMKEVFTSHKTIDTGLKHGTLTVLSQHHPIEITTYRKDSTYADHRHPDAVQFTSAIEEDCARRDFTINAFCYNDSEGIKDFFHGREDIDAKILRCIGDPEQRFEEDALRILRAIRFAAQLHFQIEPDTKKAIFQQKELLSYISTERIHEELNGFLQADVCGEYLDTYKEVFTLFLPELNDVKDWQKMLVEVDRAGKNANARMAVLLSETEQPASVLKRMKYANDDLKQICAMIKHRHTDVSDIISLRKFLSVYPYDFDQYLMYRSAFDTSFPKEKVKDMHDCILNNHDCISLTSLQIKGNDVTALGYRGPQIAEVLNDLLNAVMEEKVKNTKNDLTAYLRRN
jgi:tRNA nucleotidyltransferase (CCA-adding enzyme)